jgi:hypothetical protein
VVNAPSTDTAAQPDLLAPARAWLAGCPDRPEGDEELAQYLAGFALDKAADDLVDACGIKSIQVENGQMVLALAPARELLLAWCAAARAALDEKNAANYLAMDFEDGEHPEDAYTFTIQRMRHPTPHEFRVRAEQERDEALERLADVTAERDRLAEACRRLAAALPIEYLVLDRRAYNVLTMSHRRIRSVGELLELTDEDITDLRNAGVKTLANIKDRLRDAFGLTLRAPEVADAARED